jgi:hypothetical protein
MLGQVKAGKARLGYEAQVSLFHFRPGYAKLSEFRHDKAGSSMLGLVRTVQVMLGKFRSS